MTNDVYSRLITGWEVHLDESAQHTAILIDKACLKHGVSKGQLVLLSDNGSPMKDATMLATLLWLGVVPLFNRLSVSDHNPYSETLFRTLKYTPAYPAKPFMRPPSRLSLSAARIVLSVTGNRLKKSGLTRPRSTTSHMKI
ncbi:hypothetical protein [Alcaligenes sp. CHO6]|jgi:putative transposase|uniref:hypothetical protein n=1 Tax=Alcaligenes sp. CHO6 TaxID=3123298 RepID=UPI00301440C1